MSLAERSKVERETVNRYAPTRSTLTRTTDSRSIRAYRAWYWRGGRSIAGLVLTLRMGYQRQRHGQVQRAPGRGQPLQVSPIP
eukprot:1553611-Rhodomonas_salina.1